jgi:hypothetical protein
MSRLSIVMFHEPCIDGAMSAYIVHRYFLSNGFKISNFNFFYRIVFYFVSTSIPVKITSIRTFSYYSFVK